MSEAQLLTVLLAAGVGAIGSLLVGLYLQRRNAALRAKNAGRAVYFELMVNTINVQVARDHGMYEPLGRSVYELLLPELATWLPAEGLLTVARAYMGHAGYLQLQRDATVPAGPRKAALIALAGIHEAALALLRGRVFSAAELARMRAAGDPLAEPATAAGMGSAARV
jgi:hypothetical protein